VELNTTTLYIEAMGDLSSRGLTSERIVIYARTIGTRPELMSHIRRAIEDRGDMVVATYLDDARITGRGKYANWHRLIASLDTVDRVVVADAGDLPGRSVADILKILGLLRDRGVTLHLHNIETGTTTSVVLDIVQAYRRAKLSHAIRVGQAKALAAGKRIARPIVPPRVQERIQAALAQGGGVRPTARLFNVSPASVINIRRAMAAV
jgi:DNA invertase Pin-like site-specific DNA recombinase